MKVLIFTLLFSLPFLLKAQNSKIFLDSCIITFNDSVSIPKQPLPLSVYPALQKHSFIKNPFESCNQYDIDFAEQIKYWQFVFDFEVSTAQLRSDNIILKLGQIDTYANIYINDKLLDSTNNSFVNYKWDIKNLLNKGKNKLIVRLKPIEDFIRKHPDYDSLIPGGDRVFARKAQYQFGWDWAPNITDLGIYQKGEIHFLNQTKIENVFVKTIEYSEDFVIQEFEIDLLKLEKGEYKIEIDDKTYSYKTKINHNKPIVLKKKIHNPNYWSTNNYGEQNIYKSKINIKKKGEIIDSTTIKYGIRKVDLDKTSLPVGNKFAIKINGQEVFMKGANIIPAHHFISRVTDSMYISLVQQAKTANMNMLRVWGGGYYLPEAFYEECDKQGIAVWQDFMFAGGMYPYSVLSVNEIEQQIKRLNNHPSVIVWCGNNEISEGWHNWGWTDNLTKSDSAKLWLDYQSIFESMIPLWVDSYTSQSPYHPSSPGLGRGNPNYIYSGDAHNWWVWHDDSTFANYENQIPRFMSEFGFQALPHIETVKDFSSNGKIPNVDELQCHQKHHSGFERIESAMKRNLPMPKSIEDSVYLSQVLQAIGIEKGIRAQRTNEYCKGSLFWQLNDCWPVISWSTIDFNGYWKALMYRSRIAFEEVVIRTDFKNDSIKIYIGNENKEFKNVELKIELKSMNGSVLSKVDKIIKLNSNQQGLIYNELNKEFAKLFKENNYIKTTIICEQDTFVNYYFKNNFKDIDLQANSFDYRIDKENSQLIIEAKSFNAFVAILNNDKVLEDNYFHMEAGEKRIINIQDFDELNVISLNGFY